MNNQQDSFVWGCSPTGNFTIKSATWIQNTEVDPHEYAPLLRKVWKSDLAPKIKIFSWLLTRGRLKTKSRLHRNKGFSLHAVVACATTYNCMPRDRSNISPSNTSAGSNITWNPPHGRIKINFDGSVLQQTSDAAVGFILIDDVGCPIIAFAQKIGKTNVPIALR
ncbi:hypothetical protein ACLB2K_002826 [Fragaria x ananassa]